MKVGMACCTPGQWIAAMKLVMLLCFMALASVAHAETLVWKTEAELESMTELPGCDPDTDDNCHDSVAYIGRSKFGVNVYITYFEGVRMQIGFGSPANGSSIYLAGQMHAGAYDWGGQVIDGVFKPLFVIKRFYEADLEKYQADTSKTYLSIFKLKQDSPSCAISTGEGTVDNATARRLAENAMTGPECTE